MMAREQDFLARHVKLLVDERAHPQLIEEPGDHRFAKHLHRTGEHLERGQQNALELDEGLFEESNVFEVSGGDSLGLKYIANRLERKLEVVFFSREPFFLCRRYQHAIPEQRGGRVVKEAGDTKY